MINEKTKIEHREVKIIDLIDKTSKFTIGKVNVKEYLKKGKYPIVDQGKNYIVGYHNDEKLLYTGKLPVVVFGDHTLNIKFINFPFIQGADGLKILIPIKNINAKFLGCMINYVKPKGKSYRRHFTIIKEFKIPIPHKNNKPDLEAQKRIVEKLELIEKLKENRLKSDELTKEYLNSLFLNMFHNKKFDKVELEEETSLVSSGSTPKGGSEIYLDNGEILFIRSQNVLMNKFSNHDKLYLPLNFHNSMKRTWVKRNDVLLNITGASIGRSAIYLGQNDKANVNQHVCIIRLKKGSNLNSIYLNYFLTSNEFQNYIKRINAGGTREALNFTQIKKFQILIPPIELQKQFAEIVQKVEQLKEYQQESKEEIENLYNKLMQQAFKGEL